MLAAKRSAGVVPEVNRKNLLHAGYVSNPGFQIYDRRHEKIQNRGISGPTKRTDVLQQFHLSHNISM